MAENPSLIGKALGLRLLVERILKGTLAAAYRKREAAGQLGMFEVPAAKKEKKPPSVPGAPRVGLIKEKVPVHREMSTGYEYRWKRPGQGSLFEMPEASDRPPVHPVFIARPAAAVGEPPAEEAPVAKKRARAGVPTGPSLLEAPPTPAGTILPPLRSLKKKEGEKEHGEAARPIRADLPGRMAGGKPEDVSGVEGAGHPGSEGEVGGGTRPRAGGRTGEPGVDEGRGGGDRLPDVPVSPAVSDPVAAAGEPAAGKAPRPAFEGRGLSGEVGYIGNEQDLRLTPADVIGEGSLRQRAAQNLRALEILKTLKEEQRDATPEERRELSKFSGWGSFGQAFHPKFNDYARGQTVYHYDRYARGSRAVEVRSYEDIPDYVREGWTDADKAHWELNQEIRPLLSDEEYEAAQKSTLNAHFTSPKIVGALWDAVRHLGFRGGRVLEPSAGTGYFLGFEPDDLTRLSRRTAVELEPQTGEILKQCYPNANVQIQGFEQTPLPENYFDLAISNVPFGNFPVHDAEYQRTGRGWLTRQIHNYFFAKSLDKVRPGGLVCFISSHHTMDAKTHERFREYLAEQADLVGAIRLPNDAFAQNAGTRVTTDVLILRKKDPEFERLHPRDPEGRFIEKWTATAPLRVQGGEEIQVNEYFAAHPESMLGVMGVGSGFGQMAATETGMKSDGRDLGQALKEAISRLPQDVMSDGSDYEQAQKAQEEAIRAPEALKVGAFTIQDGKVYRNMRESLSVPGRLEEAGGDSKRLAGLVGLREAAQTLISAQYEDVPDSELQGLRATLNERYDAFVGQFGNLHEKANVRAFRDDPDSGLVLSLERVERDGGAISKADIFAKRTITPAARAASASSPVDALGICLNERGKIDWKHISRLLQRDPEGIRDELAAEGAVYRDPSQVSDPVSLGWVPVDEYLSGAVRAKLRQAEAAAREDGSFAPNVEALKAVQPEDLDPTQISARLGATWIPVEYYQEFFSGLLRAGYGDKKPVISYNRGTGDWNVQLDNPYLRQGVENTRTWGTQRVPAHQILAACLAQQFVTVKDHEVDDHGKERDVVNQQETFAARELQDKMKEEFKRWIWADQDRAEHCVRLYNDLFNDSRDREFDGSHLTLPGMAAHIATGLRKHIKDGIWRAIAGGNVLFDHCVGSGKTRIIAGVAMELRRLGLKKKPMIVVPNHLLSKTDAEIRQFYPGAKILTVWARNWTPRKRKELTSHIATGDWDAVVITHSAFGQIPMSDEMAETQYRETVEQIKDTMRDMGVDPDAQPDKKDRTAKQLFKMLERVRVNHKKRLQKIQDRQDTSLRFDELGVDSVIVDECFPYETPVLTERGWLPIGEVVEKALDVRVASVNLETGGLEWQRIARWLKNPLRGTLVKVVHEGGEFLCTPNHKVWTAEEGYVCAGDLTSQHHLEEIATFRERSGSSVVISRGGDQDHVAGLCRMPAALHAIVSGEARSSAEVLLPEVQGRSVDSAAPGSQDVRVVREGVHVPLIGGDKQREAALLQQPVCGIVAELSAGSCGSVQFVDCRGAPDGMSGQGEPGSVGQDEDTQPDGKPGHAGEDAAVLAGQDLPCPRRQWNADRAAETSGRCSRSADGICHLDFGPEGSVSVAPALLQGRHRGTEEQDDHRGGRQDAPAEAVALPGCQKDGGLERSRVVRVEVLERGSAAECATRGGSGPWTYNLEVYKHHNYLAAGVLVSNCHLFKNLYFPTKMSRIAGLGGTESGRALDLFAKTQWMLKKYGGKGLYFATGTPISNTMAEMYTMNRYLDLQGLREKGVDRFDSWAANFGEVVNNQEASPEGGYRPRLRFAKFVNIPELQKLYRKFADVKLVKDLPYLPLPERRDQAHAAASNESLSSYMESIRKRAEAIRGLGSSRPDPSEDNMLKLSSDARKASLDVRLVDKDATDDPNGKVNRCVREVARIYHDPRVTDRQGTQIVFLDLSTPKPGEDREPSDDGSQPDEDTDTAEEQGLRTSVYEDMRRKLVAAGVREDEIAFAHDFNTDAKKDRLAELMNSGKLRILIGSTEKAGSGLNVQERLFALHHLDCPWRPADLEQREGRIVRQGNMHKDWGIPVEIHRYVTEGSFDEFMWQTVLAKAKFIEQIRQGTSQVREMEDISGIAQSAAEMLAWASGDPIIKEKVDVESKLARLSALKAQHQQARWQGQSLIASHQRRIGQQREHIETVREIQQTYKAHKPEKFAIEVGGQGYDTYDGGAAALNRELMTHAGQIGDRPREIGRYAGFSLLVGMDGREPALFVHTPSGREVVKLSQPDLGESSQSVFATIGHQLRQGDADVEKAERRVRDSESDIEKLKAENAKAFAHEEDLAQLTARVEEIYKQLGHRDSDAATDDSGGAETLSKAFERVWEQVVDSLEPEARPVRAVFVTRPAVRAVFLAKGFRDPVADEHVRGFSEKEHALHISEHGRDFVRMRRELLGTSDPQRRRALLSRMRVMAQHRAQHLLARHAPTLN